MDETIRLSEPIPLDALHALPVEGNGLLPPEVLPPVQEPRRKSPPRRSDGVPGNLERITQERLHRLGYRRHADKNPLKVME
jgi:hypothetical protein